mmetsp:Transcript_122325/g.237945  ORF Transcript_122325/g.237945 Transcript_122325/m.237945 type:complete len:207 (-) Transcript_122325:388-1008(-)
MLPTSSASIPNFFASGKQADSDDSNWMTRVEHAHINNVRSMHLHRQVASAMSLCTTQHFHVTSEPQQVPSKWPTTPSAEVEATEIVGVLVADKSVSHRAFRWATVLFKLSNSAFSIECSVSASCILFSFVSLSDSRSEILLIWSSILCFRVVLSSCTSFRRCVNSARKSRFSALSDSTLCTCSSTCSFNLLCVAVSSTIKAAAFFT